MLCDEEAEELWDVLALPEEELLPEDAVLCELLLSAPFELEDELDELDELELPEAAGAPATITSSVLLVTVQSL